MHTTKSLRIIVLTILIFVLTAALFIYNRNCKSAIEHSYVTEDLNLDGEIVGITDKSELLIYKDGVISTFDPNTNRQVIKKQIDKEYAYNSTRSKNIVFSNKSSIQVYNISTGKTAFYPFTPEFIAISPDGLKILLNSHEGEKIRIVDSDSNVAELKYMPHADFESPFYWLDNQNLIKTTQENNSYTYGDFLLLIKEIAAGDERLLYP